MKEHDATAAATAATSTPTAATAAQRSNTTEEAMATFLLNGGQVQQLDYRQSGRVEGDNYNPWGAGRKKKTADSPLKSTAEDEET
jgi:hypothetical protein